MRRSWQRRFWSVTDLRRREIERLDRSRRAYRRAAGAAGLCRLRYLPLDLGIKVCRCHSDYAALFYRDHCPN